MRTHNVPGLYVTSPLTEASTYTAAALVYVFLFMAGSAYLLIDDVDIGREFYIALPFTVVGVFLGVYLAAVLFCGPFYALFYRCTPKLWLAAPVTALLFLWVMPTVLQTLLERWPRSIDEWVFVAQKIVHVTFADTDGLAYAAIVVAVYHWRYLKALGQSERRAVLGALVFKPAQ